MNKQTLIILAGGFGAALFVALLMQAVLNGGQKEVVADETAVKTEILLASKNLSVGDKLDADDMEWTIWPEANVFEGAVLKSDYEEGEYNHPLKGRLRRNVAKGEPLMKSAIIDKEKGNFVAAGLADGTRAMAIRVKAESSVGGFITPGDYVDVIMTYEVKLPRDQELQDASVSVINKKAVQTVLQNLRVVAVDQEAEEIEETKIARTVTLEVTPNQSETLALAESMGTLSLALRKLGDNTITLKTETDNKSQTDVRMSNVMQEILGGGDNSSNRQRTVKIYNGGQVNEIAVTPMNDNNNNEQLPLQGGVDEE